MSDREILFQRWGWALFVVSAVFYLVASVEARSVTAIAGSLFFLGGCIVFLIPMMWTKD